MHFFTWVPFLIMFLDQASKRLIMHLSYNEITFKIPFIESKIVWNKGISFGMLGVSYYNVLIYGAILISICLIVVTWMKAKNKLDIIAWGLIVGGGFSNLCDRVLFGAVLEFISFSFYKFHFPWVFNIADVSITIGACLLARHLIRKNKKIKKLENANFKK